MSDARDTLLLILMLGRAVKGDMEKAGITTAYTDDFLRGLEAGINGEKYTSPE